MSSSGRFAVWSIGGCPAAAQAGNLIAFLDAFKAIRGLKPSIQTTIPEDAAGEGLREAVAKPPGWGSAA
jgi:hypothetical protein